MSYSESLPHSFSLFFSSLISYFILFPLLTPPTLSLSLSLSPIAKKFNQVYYLHQELGSGAFSVVKLASHKTTHEKVAAKIITKKSLSDEDLKSLTTEISILKSLEYSHIIK